MKGNCNTAQSYGAGQPQIKKVNYNLAMGAPPRGPREPLQLI